MYKYTLLVYGSHSVSPCVTDFFIKGQNVHNFIVIKNVTILKIIQLHLYHIYVVILFGQLIHVGGGAARTGTLLITSVVFKLQTILLVQLCKARDFKNHVTPAVF